MSESAPPAHRRPPSSIAPREFFERWLPAAYDAWRAGRPLGRPQGRSPGSIEVRVCLDGDDGGSWDLKVGDAALEVSAPADSGVPVTIMQSVPDWRAAACGEEGGFDLLPPSGGPLDLLFIDPAMRQLIDRVQGTVRMEVLGYNGRTWVLTLKLGDQPMPTRPDAVITVEAETWAKLTSRQMQPTEAYFAGQFHIVGDTGLAMQLAMALVPRFG